MKEAVVVGLGFAGGVMARELAEAGYQVVALDRRNHIAGNMYEALRSNGLRVHLYGPHIFHTHSDRVYQYLQKFSDFYPYTHRVLGKINGKLIPIPFNFTGIDQLFSEEKAAMLKEQLSQAFPLKDRISVSELLEHSNDNIAQLGQFIFERVFVNYTAKQWGVPVSEVDTSVINRVPVVIGYDDRYFSDPYQAMPKEGYSALFQELLSHPNISVQLGCEASDYLKLDFSRGEVNFRGSQFSGPLCYSGALDELCHYQLGELPYRSLDMNFEDLDCEVFQPTAVVNYPNEEDYTRITEFKHLTLQKAAGKTSILKEIPKAYQVGKGEVPYYPILGTENQNLYNRYRNLVKDFSQLYLCGRLAEYRYYNMDAVIHRALEVSAQIIEKK